MCSVAPGAVLHFLASEPAAFPARMHFSLVALSALGAGGAAVALAGGASLPVGAALLSFSSLSASAARTRSGAS